MGAEAAVHNDKFQQSRIRVESASASFLLLHAGLPCCAAATLPQCKLCSRSQSSNWCLRSSWFGLTCPLRNDWRRGSGQCMQLCSSCSALAVGMAFGWGRQAAVVCFQPEVGAHHTGDELM